MCIGVKLIVFFEEPFWVGVFEKYEDDHFSVCRVVFGAEPKDYEVYNFVQKEYYNLKFSNPLLTDVVQEKEGKAQGSLVVGNNIIILLPK